MDIDEGQETVEQEVFEQEEKKTTILSRSRTRSRSRSRYCSFLNPVQKFHSEVINIQASFLNLMYLFFKWPVAEFC